MARRQEQDDGDLEALIGQFSFFVDQFNSPCVSIPVDDHLETYSVKSESYKRHLVVTMRENGIRLSKGKIEKLMLMSEAEAINSRKQYSLYNRCAFYEGSYYLDLCNKDWSVVKIVPGRWEITKLDFPLFKRYSHMKPLEVKQEGLNEDFERFIGLHNFKNVEQKLLVACYLATCLIPGIPHPIKIVIGQQGSAKSNLQEHCRRVIDNSEINRLSMPHDSREFVQQLQHHYMPVYDNVRWLRDNQQDDFCRAVTGEGFSKRELYSDDADVIYKYMRCPMLNGINVPGTRADFLDRAIIITLERIPKNKRRLQKDVDEEIDRLAPKVLKYLLDVVSRALPNIESVKDELKNLPRMADFCVYAESVAREMGHKPLQFYDAYMTNINEQNYVVVENNIVSYLIEQFMVSKTEWEGTAAAFYNNLRDLGETLKVNLKQNGFPGAPNALSRKITDVKHNLLEVGISVESKIERNATMYYVKKISPLSPPSPPTSGDSGGRGDIFTTSINSNQAREGDPEDIKVEDMS